MKLKEPSQKLKELDFYFLLLTFDFFPSTHSYKIVSFGIGKKHPGIDVSDLAGLRN
ncbi:MAG TPA: hypothetical protein V6D28_26950 [Leptolyngbyaceae cyanobacterium]